MKKLLMVIPLFLLLCFTFSYQNSEEVTDEHQPIVEELITLLRTKPELKEALEESIEKAESKIILTLVDYLEFLDGMLEEIPTNRNTGKGVLFYYCINHSPVLQEDDLFQEWVGKFAEDLGSFLDTPESAKGIETFLDVPYYNLSDYFVGPSGWLTFNQFFAREVKPGKRPIAELCNDSVIVSPADARFQGQWEIDENSNKIIHVKNFDWTIEELLNIEDHPEESEKLKDLFAGGIFMHSFLSVVDYHRYHVPVGGEVVAVWNIHGRKFLDVYKREDGGISVRDGEDYQFRQERGLVIIKSAKVGYVAVLPIGMAQISSVNLNVEEGAVLHKGQEFGYFLFGGSDIIVLFQKDKVRITAEKGKKYLQGEKIGETID
jgi:phosphatidylserine decarboxylase precursor